MSQTQLPKLLLVEASANTSEHWFDELFAATFEDSSADAISGVQALLSRVKKESIKE